MAEENGNENKLAEAAKEAAKKAGNKVKTKIGLFFLKILIPIISIILVGIIVFGIFNAVGDVVQKFLEEVADFFTLDEDGAIIISDEQIDTIINGISGLGVSMDGLKLMGNVDYTDPEVEERNKKALREYIRKFYEAQAMTQTLNTNPNTPNGKTYGTVYVHRTKGEDVVEPTTQNQLIYIPYEQMVKKKENGDTNITDYFSISETGELVIAGWTHTVIKTNGETTTNETTVNLRNINYKSAISQYTTSMNFFLYLAMISENPEFAKAVTDLVRQSEIRITLMDSESTNITKETSTYTENTKTRKRVRHVTYEAWDTDKKYPQVTYTYEEDTKKETKTETTETTITSTNPVVAITYVKTWFCEQTITYNKKTDGPNPSSNTAKEEDEEEPELTGEGSVTWKTGQSTTYEGSSTIIKYEEATRGNVIDRTGEKGSQGIKDLNGNGQVDENERVDENSTFLGLLDNKFKIPNTTRYDAAGGNIVSGAEMLFYLLQKDAASQNLEQIMRYILFKYTGRDYGVTELDFSIFNAREFRTVGALGNELLTEYIHYWEHSTPPPTNADGTKYIIEDDGAGHPTVGYGIDIFNGGYASLFEQAGYPTNIGGEVDKEFVDALEKQEIESKLNAVRSATAGLDLKEYQIHALASRAYNCGVTGAVSTKRGSPALNFVDSYNKYWNASTDDLFESQNSNANFAHNLYVQYMSKPVTSEGKVLAGLERRRKSEWTLFQTGYYDVLNKWYKAGGNLLETADQVHRDEMSWTYSTGGDLYWNNINMSLNNPNRVTCCATYVSCVIYAAGYATEEQMNSFNYNYCPTLYSYFAGQGWEVINSYDALEPGDIVFMNYHDGGQIYDHVQLYAGNDTWYNAGDTTSIQRNSPFSQGSWARQNFYVALRPTPIS